MAQKIYLGLVGGIFVVSGLFAYIDPIGLGEAMGLAPLGPSGLTEIRATHGGIGVGIGLLLISGLWSQRLAYAGLACTVFAVGALALTRLVAEVFGHGTGISTFQGAAIVFELIVFALGVLFFRRAAFISDENER